MKKLPELYKNKISLPSNNKKYCYVEENNYVDNNKKIEDKIKLILNNPNYLNNIPVLIKTKNKEYTTSIVSRVNNNLLTLSNEVIPVNDIVSIEIL
jgi:hypothetical protein